VFDGLKNYAKLHYNNRQDEAGKVKKQK
jgi:hypothetical protein